MAYDSYVMEVSVSASVVADEESVEVSVTSIDVVVSAGVEDEVLELLLFSTELHPERIIEIHYNRIT